MKARSSVIFSIALVLFSISVNGQSKQEKKERIEKLAELARTADSISDFKTSIQYYSEILTIDSSNVRALLNRGKALISTHEIVEGFADLNKAVAFWPHELTYF